MYDNLARVMNASRCLGPVIGRSLLLGSRGGPSPIELRIPTKHAFNARQI